MSRITTRLFFALPVWVAAQVGVASTFYVSPSGSHTPPYNTIGKAATNIQSAVNVATNAGDTVRVLDGTYFVTTPVTVTEDITVIGANGPDHTIVNGSGLTHCFDLGDASCVISGLTITNGYNSGDGGGIACTGTAPIITNCVLTGNYAANYGGGIIGGTIKHSIIRNNMAENSGGGASGTSSPALIYDSLIAYNVVSNDFGGGVEFCNLYNCTIVGNSAPDTGGADSCNIYNSIVYSNTAPMNADAAYSTIDASCIGSAGDGIEAGSSYITSDPLFVDFSAQDYRLETNSPCIDAGSNSYVLNATDLDGNPRIVGTVDMGAYELFVDTDKDGMSDADEAIAGTDPNDKFSYFAITNWSPGSFTIEWPAFSNREYRVYRAESLQGSFNQAGPVIYYPTNSYTDTANAAEDSGFYKVEVRLQ